MMKLSSLGAIQDNVKQRNALARTMTRTNTTGTVPVTVVIPTLNEEDRLPACLLSIWWASEIIVADAGSTDRTRDIARRFGAVVLEGCGPTIADQKNAAIARASHRWVLSMDADERASDELASEIAAVVAAPEADAYRIQMRNRYLGAPYELGGWSRDWHVRLYRSSARWIPQRVHERLDVTGRVADLRARLEHESYRDLAHQLEKGHRYAVWGAQDLAASGRRVRVSDVAVRPAWRFFKTYLLEGMWREGMRGFVFAAVHAWCGFAKYALLWDEQRKQRATAAAALIETTLETPIPTAL